MSSGHTHDRVTLWSLPWVVGASFLLVRDGEITLIVAGTFLFSGLMFGPDLDIYSVQFRRWGKLRWIWLPYQKMLRHRSKLSHGPILGTGLRVIYLFSWISLLGVLGVSFARSIWGFYWNWQQFGSYLFKLTSEDYREAAIAGFLGLELGAMSHYLCDGMGSFYKRRARLEQRKRKRVKKRSKK